MLRWRVCASSLSSPLPSFCKRATRQPRGATSSRMDANIWLQREALRRLAMGPSVAASAGPLLRVGACVSRVCVFECVRFPGGLEAGPWTRWLCAAPLRLLPVCTRAFRKAHHRDDAFSFWGRGVGWGVAWRRLAPEVLRSLPWLPSRAPSSRSVDSADWSVSAQTMGLKARGGGAGATKRRGSRVCVSAFAAGARISARAFPHCKGPLSCSCLPACQTSTVGKIAEDRGGRRDNLGIE